MRRLTWVGAALAAIAIGTVVYWRWNRRFGAAFMNEVLNPFLVGRNLAGAGRSELATLEHVGRRSGLRRLTPVHPVATRDGFRIVVPLGPKSEWARNVLAAGHCRMQLHDTVYELDEPALVRPGEIDGLSAVTRGACSALGFMYMRLHRFAERPGTLEPTTTEPVTIAGATTSELQPAEKPTTRLNVAEEGEPAPTPA